MKTSSRLLIPDDHVGFWTQLFPAVDPAKMRAIFALRSVAKLVNEAASEWLAPFGLTSAKYNYLVVLYVEGRPLMLGELKAGIHTTSASVTGMIKALEADGLVHRSENPADARSAFVELTRKGRTLIERVFPVHHEYIDTATRSLSKQQVDELLAMCLSIGAGFEDLHPIDAAQERASSKKSARRR